MTKAKAYDELTRLLNCNCPNVVDDIIINLCNYFSTDELERFINHLKDERK